jgi:hypothetical protein
MLSCILNDHGTSVGEVVEVGLESQVVMEGLDVGWQHLSRGSNRGRSMVVSTEVSAHVSPVGAVSLGGEGVVCVSRGCECSAGCVVNDALSGGVDSEGRGAAGVQLSP